MLALLAMRRRDAAAPTAPTESDPNRDPTGSTPAVTTLVRLGDEPDDVVTASVLIAREGGPTAILADSRRPLPDGLLGSVATYRAERYDAALCDAVAELDSPAVVVVSARSAPSTEACRQAAERLGGKVGWVVGRVEAFSAEGFAPDRWETLSRCLRERAVDAGLNLWEPDATVVRADLLRDRPLQPGQTWGSWLRERRREGLHGATTDEVLARRATPLDPESYWPDAVARQRAATADLAAATRTGPRRARFVAAALLCRELHVVPTLCWMAVLAAVGVRGSVPVEAKPLFAVCAVVAAALLRWAVVRWSLGVRPDPRAELMSSLHHLPGSLASLPAALHGDLRPLRGPVPTRPLVWAALAMTAVAAFGLLDQNPAEPVSKLSVGASLLLVAVLWAFSMHSLVQRSWRRSTHRVPLSIDVTIDGHGATSVDVSPGGLAAATAPGSVPALGAAVEVVVQLDDGSALTVPATIASLRRHGDAELVGLSLELDRHTVGPWLAQVFRAASSADADVSETGVDVAVTAGAPRRGSADSTRWTRVSDRALQGLVTVVSIALVGLLAAAMLGFRPLVIRSPSMVPTFHIGDVVFAEQVPASTITPGDVVTQPESSAAESITHRVVRVERRDLVLEVETQGDANQASEVWEVRPDTLVGRTRWSLPWIGRVATGVRTSGAQLVVGATVLGLVVLATIAPRRRRGSPTEAAGDQGAVTVG